MAIGDVIVGIDVDPTKVSCCLGQINKFNQVEILNSSVAPCDGFKKGNVVSPDAVARAIRFAISDIEENNDFMIKSAYINIVGRYVNVCKTTYSVELQNKYDGVTQENIDDIIKGASQIKIPNDYQIIDIVPSKFITDTKITDDPIGIFTNTLTAELDVVVAEKHAVKAIASSLQKAGLSIDGIVCNAFSKRDIILTNEEKENGVILLDVGSHGIDVSVFEKNGLLYTDYIPLGGETITSDIAYALNISTEEAQKLKKQYGLADSSYIDHDYNIKLSTYEGADKSKSQVKCSELVEIISARVEELFEIIKSGLEDNGLVGIATDCVITGDGFNSINKCDKLANRVLNVNVRFGNAKTANMIKQECINSYGVVKYISNIKHTKNIGSTVILEDDNTFISSTVKSIKKIFKKNK